MSQLQIRTGDGGLRLMASATREPPSPGGDFGFPTVASATRVAAHPRVTVGSRLLAAATREHAPNSNSKRVAPKRLSRRVRSRKGSRPTVSSTVSLSLSRVVGLPLSACRCWSSDRSWLAAVGLPLPSGCRFAAVGLRDAVGLPHPPQKFEFPSACARNNLCLAP